MTRQHWTHRVPRKSARCVLVLLLVMLLPAVFM